MWPTLRAALQGLHRVPKEYFALYAARRDRPGAPLVRLPGPLLAYRADPFPVDREGSTWVFFEEFEYLRHKGRIAAMRLSPDLAPQEVRTVLDLPHHLSYPHVFEHAGGLFMVPESCANRSVDLYECTGFPDRWVLRRRLLEGLDAVDTDVLHHGGRWWLVTGVRTEGAPGRHLAVFHGPDLLAGPWTPHPVNEERRGADLPNQGGRNGGPFFEHRGRWVRPVQHNPAYYGQALEFRALVRADEEAWEEERVDLPDLPGQAAHHLAFGRDLLVLDHRERISHLPWRRPAGWPGA